MQNRLVLQVERRYNSRKDGVHWSNKVVKAMGEAINDIQSVNITYPSVTDDVKEISSSEDIELALKLTGFLKYDLFGEVNSEEEPAITITYFLKDGTSKTISANNTTVWWNNKIHVIKDKEMFVNLTEGIFFLEDLQTK